MRRQQGIALVIVLWGVTLLSLLAVSLAQSSGLASRQTAHAIAAAQARAQLDEALARAALGLLSEQPAQRWRADGTLHSVTLSDGHAEIRALAETGRIDLNHAPPILLQSLLRRAAGSAAAGDRLLAALAARTDPTTGRPLTAVAELAGFPGVTAALYQALAEAATVHNPSGSLDWRTAGKAALAAVPGLTADQVGTLLAGRGQSQYTPDAATAELLAKAGAVDQSQGGGNLVSVQITILTSGGARSSAEALLQLLPQGQQPFRILEWRAPL